MNARVTQFCWHCPICDVDIRLDDMSQKEMDEIQASVISGDSVMKHQTNDGFHSLELIENRTIQ